MAGLRATARRNDVADDLLGLEAQANAAVDQLIAVKTNLLNLKEAVNAEDIFSEEDEAEVQAIVVGLRERIQKDLVGS